MIVTSTHTEGPTQPDGRRWVKERHTDDRGEVYEFEWLGEQAADLVLAARADTLSRQLSDQRATEALVAGTRLPLTKLQFRELFTAAERAGIDAFRASFEQIAALTAEQKASIRTGFADFDTARNIVRPFLPPVLAMLGLFVSLGLLTDARRQAIIEAGNA
ncbi:MAG: hypothetical protein ACK5PF_01210 [bacterium]|jgi:hypothetical protein